MVGNVHDKARSLTRNSAPGDIEASGTLDFCVKISLARTLIGVWSLYDSMAIEKIEHAGDTENSGLGSIRDAVARARRNLEEDIVNMNVPRTVDPHEDSEIRYN